MGSALSGPVEVKTTVAGAAGYVAPTAAKLRRDLDRYRYLLSTTMDAGAIAAIKALIDETEAELRRRE